MDKTELKKVLKPLVKQCVKEALLEEGVLSRVVSEVVAGFGPILTESTTQQVEASPPRSEQSTLLEQQRAELQEEKARMLKERKRKLLDASGFGNEIFEGVEPLRKGGDPSEGPAQGALAGVDPNDAGVDITGIMALGASRWDKLV
tara:strand:- start:589 stop:1026 length:438 start_codon:yes stop_codon:yes gene_type:complete